MYSKIMLFGLLFLFLSVGAVKAEDTLAAEPNQQMGTQNQKSVSGTLESIADAMLSVKTSDETKESTALKPRRRARFRHGAQRRSHHSPGSAEPGY